MPITPKKILTAASISMLTGIMSGCFSHGGPHSLYMLHSSVTPTAPLTVHDPASGREQTVLGVGPIRLAEYLDRTEILVGDGHDSLVRLEDTDQWSEPLRDGLSRTLTLDLQHRLGNAFHVSTYPWSRHTAPALQLELNVEQFHIDRHTGKGMLIVDWSLLHNDKLLDRNRSQVAMQATGTDVDSIVKAMSDALVRFSDEIAVHINNNRQP